MKTYEQFTYNEGFKLSKDQIQKGLETVQSKMPINKFIKYMKKYKKELKYIIDKFTDGENTIYVDKLLVKNEGFEDSFIYSLFIEPFSKNGDFGEKIMGGLMWVSAIIVGFLMYALSVMAYLNFFYTPMERGIIQKKEYRQEYTTKVPIFQKIGSVSVISGYVTTHHPESYNIEIKELNGDGVEIWNTENMILSNEFHQGDTISWNDSVYNVLKGK